MKESDVIHDTATAIEETTAAAKETAQIAKDTIREAEKAAAPQTTEAVRKGAETKTEIRGNHGKAKRECERIRKQRAYRS